jgi:uncharacterized membrane protein YeaQ/YmgE (transglycosylase-associated protein family)
MMILVLIAVAVIVLLLLAGAIVGLTLKLLWWAIIGVAIGALARLVLPGKQQVGILTTAGAGLAGSFGGALVARAFGWGSFVQFILAIGVAAAVILALAGREVARR